MWLRIMPRLSLLKAMTGASDAGWRVWRSCAGLVQTDPFSTHSRFQLHHATRSRGPRYRMLIVTTRSAFASPAQANNESSDTVLSNCWETHEWQNIFSLSWISIHQIYLIC